MSACGHGGFGWLLGCLLACSRETCLCEEADHLEACWRDCVERGVGEKRMLPSARREFEGAALAARVFACMLLLWKQKKVLNTGHL